MKRIIKSPPPREYVDFCKQPGAEFDGPGFPKDILRQNLLNEQGFICCYCMRRIPESMFPYVKIEHYKSRDEKPNLILTYSNLFVACTGFERLYDAEKTCDTKKGESKDLQINLLTLTPSCETLLKYNPEGEIKSINGSIDVKNQINNILNLNMQLLRIGRRQTYLGIQALVLKELVKLHNKKAKYNYIKKLKELWLSKVNGAFRPYCMIAIYYLDKKMKQYV